MRTARKKRGLTGRSRCTLHKVKGDHLDSVQSDQNVLEMIRRGRLVLLIGGQESQLREGHQARVHSDQMVLVMARHEAGPVGKQL
jgi:hypothetical protein